MPTWLFVVLYVVPLAVLWVALVFDLVARHDMRVGKKLAWGALTLITAEFGAALYVAFRPLRYPEDGLAPGTENPLAAELLDAAESGDQESLAAARKAIKLRIH